MDRLATLSASPAFGMLEPQTLRRLADAASLSRPGGANDDFLFRLGEASSGLFLIAASGQEPGAGPAVQIGFGPGAGGASAPGFRLVEGEIAGDVEFLLGGLGANPPRRIAAARALRPVNAIHLPANLIAEALASNAEFRRRLVRDASRRLADLVSGQAERGLLHPEVRFAGGLLALLDDYGHAVANRGVFASRLKQQELADALGISRRLLSLRLSDWSARGLVETVPLALPDLARVERIASFARADTGLVLGQALEDIEEMIGKGTVAAAALAAADLEVLFPGNPAVSYFMALASLRMGATGPAADIVASRAFRWDGSMASLKDRLREAWRRSLAGRHAPAVDEEEAEGEQRRLLERRLPTLAVDVAALHARLAKERLEGLDGASSEFRLAAREAAERYRLVHEASPNHFCAVNAASLFLAAGDGEEARKLAESARRLAEREGEGYWALASRAEAELALAGPEAAARLLAEAAAQPDADLARKVTTRRQLKLIERSGALDTAIAAEVLDPGRPVFFSGPLMTSRDGSDESLAEAEGSLRAGIGDWFRDRRVPLALSSAACGADILFAEAALEAGVPLHVVLPFDIDRFRELSVTVGNEGGGWEERYLRCLDGAASVAELWKLPVPRQTIDHHFLRANRHMAGEAIHAAHLLQVKPLMLAVLDKRTRASLAGTRHGAGEFEAMGHEVVAIASPFERPAPGPGPAQPGPFAPVVFAFSRVQEDNARLGAELAAGGFATRVMKDKRLAAHRLAADFAEALHIAAATAERAEKAGIGARIACDYGPVLTSRGGGLDMDALLALEAAGDLTAAAVGAVFATRAFVMVELALGGAPGRYTPITMSVEPGAEETVVLRGARQIYRVTAQ